VLISWFFASIRFVREVIIRLLVCLPSNHLQSSVAQLVARSAVMIYEILATGRFLVRSQAEEDCSFALFR
jgi:hypothetical protein